MKVSSEYIMILSWINDDGINYHYDNQPIGLYAHNKEVEPLIDFFLRSEVNEEFFPELVTILKVTTESLKEFKIRAFDFEVSSSQTYNINRLCEIGSDVLKGVSVTDQYSQIFSNIDQINKAESKYRKAIVKSQAALGLLEDNRDSLVSGIDDVEMRIVNNKSCGDASRDLEEVISIAEKEIEKYCNSKRILKENLKVGASIVESRLLLDYNKRRMEDFDKSIGLEEAKLTSCFDIVKRSRKHLR